MWAKCILAASHRRPLLTISTGYEHIIFFFQAVETLKSFEKKDTKVAATAATNLSFLYILVCTCLNAPHSIRYCIHFT
jgi:hypothetical protein